jgi:hypothetical protein
MTRAGVALAAAALGLLLPGCTIRSEREEILPWLLVKRTYLAFGSFGGSTQSTYYAKYFGFWRSLDVWHAVVLDREHALVQGEEGYGLLRQGSLGIRHVCGPLTPVSVPPGPAAVDTVDPTAHADGGVIAVRWRRIDADGRVTEEQTLSAVGDRLLVPAPPPVFAYDDAGAAYFLMMDREAARDYRHLPTGCALLSTRHNEPVVPGPEDMSWDQCRQPAEWAKILGRPLHLAGQQARDGA